MKLETQGTLTITDESLLGLVMRSMKERGWSLHYCLEPMKTTVAGNQMICEVTFKTWAILNGQVKTEDEYKQALEECGREVNKFLNEQSAN